MKTNYIKELKKKLKESYERSEKLRQQITELQQKISTLENENSELKGMLYDFDNMVGAFIYRYREVRGFKVVNEEEED